MKRELIRITFVGDIMCERPLLKAYFMNKEYATAVNRHGPDGSL